MGKLGVVKLGVVELGVVELGVVELGVVKLGVVKLGVVKLGVVKLGVGKLGAGRMGAGRMAEDEKHTWRSFCLRSTVTRSVRFARLGMSGPTRLFALSLSSVMTHLAMSTGVPV